jgi:hypothetical protein
MRFPRDARTLGAALLLVTAGCHERSSVVTIEGEVAPELYLQGLLYVTAFRDLIFCKANLFERPYPSSRTTLAKFVRSGRRYTLTFDARDMPHGGLCDWRLDYISVEADREPEPSNDTSISTGTPYVLELRSALALAADKRGGARPERPLNASCRAAGASRSGKLRCDLLERVLDDAGEPTRITLNVGYDAPERSPSAN